ncbi:DUF2235 domain-containing protein [Pseudoxanthomonas sp. Root630]|uniref:phospholipase effector Tle1 domain-containing protein n=1 Tax=Pseudoxanthomonas sp. Root630 TaxID=1736574 RepID=UPI0007031E0C|nr:DUF2235 domain-containing protein [Pseudoxanthomonas sp. Root630]KRA40078.1 hypothetical protein ASD72_16745 [Pseudoxanthomonas sp. Root630]
MGQLGNRPVDEEAVSQQQLAIYRDAEVQLAQVGVPVLLPSDDPHARLYIAAQDGTGNSMFNDKPENWSNVARIYKQVQSLNDRGIQNIAGGYVEGTFTQEGALRTPQRLADGRFGHSFDERVETAYFDLCVQAKEWLLQDPQAKIHVAGVGFSRGAEQTAALERLIEERGIRDPDGIKPERDRDGIIQKIEYPARPPLVPPGKTLQVALLFDPVSTGVEDQERALPKSTLAVFEISAMHERRDLFPDNDHVPSGFSEDRRNFNAGMPGSHSDIGGTYERNGLGILNFNLGVSFLNRLSDQPFLKELPVPTDPSQFVIHRSDQHMHGLYGTDGHDKDGVRDRVQDQSPRPGVQGKDPIDPALDAQVERRAAPAPEHGWTPQDAERRVVPAPSTHSQAMPASYGVDAIFDRLAHGAMARDDAAMNAAVADYMRSPQGHQFQSQVAQTRQAMDAREQQAELEASMLARQQVENARSPQMMRL